MIKHIIVRSAASHKAILWIICLRWEKSDQFSLDLNIFNLPIWDFWCHLVFEINLPIKADFYQISNTTYVQVHLTIWIKNVGIYRNPLEQIRFVNLGDICFTVGFLTKIYFGISKSCSITQPLCGLES